jgi:hypothetical protein
MMQRSGVVRFISSYDILGKAIPGLVGLAGLILILPVDLWTENAPRAITISSVAGFIVVAFALGLAFGESVHNLAVNIEAIVGWFSGRFRGAVDLIRSGLSWSRVRAGPRLEGLHDRVHKWREKLPLDRLKAGQEELAVPPEDEERGGFAVEGLYPSDITGRVKKWLLRRLNSISVALTSHRHLFEHQVIDQLDPYRDPEARSDLSHQAFIRAVQNEFSVEINDFERIRELYPQITSRIESASVNRAQGFQVRFSFCRSMWVVLGTYTILYTMLFIYRDYRTLRESIVNTPHVVGELIQSFPFLAIIPIAGVAALVGGYATETLLDTTRPSFGTVLLIMGICGVITLVSLYCLPFIAVRIFTLVMEPVSVSAIIVLDAVEALISLFVQLRGDQIDVYNIGFFVIARGLETEFILLLGLATLAFFDASGDYKEYYVQYLIADFCAISNTDRLPNDDNDEPTEPTQYESGEG